MLPTSAIRIRSLSNSCALAPPPHREVVPFFHRVAQSPLASRLARENAVDVFRRWNFLCSELRYLETDAKEAR